MALDAVCIQYMLPIKSRGHVRGHIDSSCKLVAYEDCCRREQKLEEKEQAVLKQQAEASSLKAELQSVLEGMRAEAEKHQSAAAEDKQGLLRQQDRLDTLQASAALLHSPVLYSRSLLKCHIFTWYMSGDAMQSHARAAWQS